MAREASAESLQDLYFALGWPEDELGSVIRDFIHSVANGGLQQYKTIFKTGAGSIRYRDQGVVFSCSSS